MALNLDMVPVVNLLFCALVVIPGLMAYRKMLKDSPHSIAWAFLLSGISHPVGIVDVAVELATLLLVLRIIGYIRIPGVLPRQGGRSWRNAWAPVRAAGR